MSLDTAGNHPSVPGTWLKPRGEKEPCEGFLDSCWFSHGPALATTTAGEALLGAGLYMGPLLPVVGGCPIPDEGSVVLLWLHCACRAASTMNERCESERCACERCECERCESERCESERCEGERCECERA